MDEGGGEPRVIGRVYVAPVGSDHRSDEWIDVGTLDLDPAEPLLTSDTDGPSSSLSSWAPEPQTWTFPSPVDAYALALLTGTPDPRAAQPYVAVTVDFAVPHVPTRPPRRRGRIPRSRFRAQRRRFRRADRAWRKAGCPPDPHRVHVPKAKHAGDGRFQVVVNGPEDSAWWQLGAHA